MFKKLMAMILTTVVFAGLLVVAPVAAFVGTDWVDDDFEGYSTAEVTANWTVGSSIDAEVVSVTGHDGNPTNALKVVLNTATTSGSSANRLTTQKTTPSSDVLVQEARIFMPEETETEAEIRMFRFGAARFRPGRVVALGNDSNTMISYYPQGEWFKVTVVYDFANTNYIAYLNDTLAFNGSFDSSNPSSIVNRFEFFAKTDNDKENYVYIDDVKWYAPAETSIASVSPEDGETGVSVGTSVTVNFDEKVLSSSVSDTAVTVTKSGETEAVQVDEMTISPDGKSVILTFSDVLDNEAVYNVSTSGLKDKYGQDIADFSSEFVTAALPQIEVSTPVFSRLKLGAGGGLTVINQLSAGIINCSLSITNNGTLTQNTIMMVCLKKNDELHGFVFSMGEIQPGQTYPLSGGFSLRSDYADYKIEVFVWDSLDGMIPLAQKYVIDTSGSGYAD